MSERAPASNHPRFFLIEQADRSPRPDKIRPRHLRYQSAIKGVPCKIAVSDFRFQWARVLGVRCACFKVSAEPAFTYPQVMIFRPCAKRRCLETVTWSRPPLPVAADSCPADGRTAAENSTGFAVRRIAEGVARDG